MVVRLCNDGYPALELRKLYRVLPDADAAAHGHMQVIDKSREAYLYSADYFAEVELPCAVEQALFGAS